MRARGINYDTGFLPGGDISRKNFDPEVVRRDMAVISGDLDWWSGLASMHERLSGFLAEVAATVRTDFSGKITYASAPWESIDWTPFDIVGVDAYRAAYNADTFRSEVRGHLAYGKPVAITEYGTCAYSGASERGGSAWQVPPNATADEDEQVRYLTELLDIFEAEGVDTALWFTFAAFNRPGPLDLGSYGVVRTLDETRWEPKKVFHAMAARYQRD
ncbi:hypothetical protein [Saccharopolyspora sp. 5N708]|uniref:hypothetical protein n=1 Tax=Saccharopolyspora sp. 5N708 TaxID=3457424 RepID=UPI003FD2473F